MCGPGPDFRRWWVPPVVEPGGAPAHRDSGLGDGRPGTAASPRPARRLLPQAKECPGIAPRRLRGRPSSTLLRPASRTLFVREAASFRTLFCLGQPFVERVRPSPSPPPCVCACARARACVRACAFQGRLSPGSPRRGNRLTPPIPCPENAGRRNFSYAALPHCLCLSFCRCACLPAGRPASLSLALR